MWFDIFILRIVSFARNRIASMYVQPTNIFAAVSVETWLREPCQLEHGERHLICLGQLLLKWRHSINSTQLHKPRSKKMDISKQTILPTKLWLPPGHSQGMSNRAPVIQVHDTANWLFIPVKVTERRDWPLLHFRETRQPQVRLKFVRHTIELENKTEHTANWQIACFWQICGTPPMHLDFD